VEPLLALSVFAIVEIGALETTRTTHAARQRLEIHAIQHATAWHAGKWRFDAQPLGNGLARLRDRL
jgi:hypothetical protein